MKNMYFPAGQKTTNLSQIKPQFKPAALSQGPSALTSPSVKWSKHLSLVQGKQNGFEELDIVQKTQGRPPKSGRCLGDQLH